MVTLASNKVLFFVANHKFDRFLKKLDDLVEKHSPLKKLLKNNIRLRNKPWINSRIQKMMYQRDRLF